MSSRKVVLIDNVYYMRTDTVADGDRITPVPGAVPRDGTGRELDEPTIEDHALAYGSPVIPAPVSYRL